MSENDSASRASNPSSVQRSSGEKATSPQQHTGQAAQEARDAAGRVGNPDIDFSASVKARELRFEEEPQTEVRFWGHPERNSVSVNERKNLPEKVRQGVTYRDVRVQSRIASELVAIEELLIARLSPPLRPAARSGRSSRLNGVSQGGRS